MLCKVKWMFQLSVLSILLFYACDPEIKVESSVDETDLSVSMDMGGAMKVFTHKMIKETGENRFASLAYECSVCTFEQWLSIEPLEGWKKGPAQVTVFSRAEMRSTPSFEGVPNTVDFLEDVPGAEYQLIAKNLDARIIEIGANGVVAESQVMRDTIFFYDIGIRIHELTSPEGEVFVLFAYGVDPDNVVIPDVQSVEFMSDCTPPMDWVYTSRVLEEILVIDTPEVAPVLAIRNEITSTWERR